MCGEMFGKMSTTKTAEGRLCIQNCAKEIGMDSVSNLIKLEAMTNAEIFALKDKASVSEEEAQAELEAGELKTIAGIKAYLEANNDTTGKGDIKNFEALLENLRDDEVIHIPFTGAFVIQVDGEDSEVNTAFALTNKRLIYKRNAGILSTLGGHGDQFGTIPIEDIYGVSSQNLLIMGSIVIDTTRDTLVIKHNKEFTNKMAGILQDHIDNFKSTVTTNQVDTSEELRKFKQLEVDGIITAEEFEAKKKELLGEVDKA